MTRHPQPVTWPRRAALVIEALGAAVAVGTLATLALAVWALAGIGALRPLLAVASGLAVGALARLAKDARRLTTTYSNRRRELLDQLCTHLETRRTQRRWATSTPPEDNTR
jgi:hypothetical protein